MFHGEQTYQRGRFGRLKNATTHFGSNCPSRVERIYLMLEFRVERIYLMLEFWVSSTFLVISFH
jgi:hypothetical protein